MTILTTTLGNGTNPSNTTVAPDDGSNTKRYLDQFTFVTNTLSDSVTALTVTVCNDPGCSSNTSDATIATMEIWNDAMTIPYFSTILSTDAAHNIGAATWNFSGGTPIPVGLASVAYRVVVTFKDHPTLDTLGEVLYPVTGRVTAFTSTYSQAGSDATSATITVDNLPPAAVNTVCSTPNTCAAGDGQVTLRWTNPTTNADSTPLIDFAQVVILRKTSVFTTEAPADGATYTQGNTGGSLGGSTVAFAGNATVFTDLGLSNGTPYSYKLFSRDTYLNYGAGVATGPFTPDVVPCSTITGGTLTTDTTCTGNLTISGGATLTLQGDITLTVKDDGSGTTGKLTVAGTGTIVVDPTSTFSRIVAVDLMVNTGGVIHSNGKGDGPGAGLGKGQNECGAGSSGNRGGGGGGYGGRGGNAGAVSCNGNSDPAQGGSPYGTADLTTIYMGSGGGNSGTSSPGGAGGGAIKIEISGTLTNDGTISANGADVTSGGKGGGGSGGSLHITAGILSGGGLMTANGGSVSNGGGGGGGGRIMVNATVISTTVPPLQVRGGSSSSGARSDGQEGSLLVITAAGTGSCAFQSPAAVYSIYADFTCSGALTVSNGATLFLHGNTTLTVSGDASVTGSGSRIVADPVGTVLSHTFVQIVANNMIVGAGASIEANGTGCPSSQSYDYVTADATPALQCRSVGGGVTAGFGEGGDGSGTSSGGGAGYGGAGGADGGGATGGFTYGDANLTTIMPGSGGGSFSGTASANVLGGAGGGAIKIDLAGTLTVNGTISADGLQGIDTFSTTTRSAGGGSGGSLYINMLPTASLAGSGQIHANGGNGGGGTGSSAGGGGGGGRIVIKVGALGNPFPALGVTLGGGSTTLPAMAGTVVLEQLDQTKPDPIWPLTINSTTATSAVLQWQATGDDGTTGGPATSFDLRYVVVGSPAQWHVIQNLPDGEFSSAFQVSGEPAPGAPPIPGPAAVHIFTVTGLSPDTDYCFAIKTTDDVGNTSDLEVAGTYSILGTPGTTSTACFTTDLDVTRPAAVTDLAADQATNGAYIYTDRIQLTWTAVGDDGTTGGTASSYEIRYALAPITDATFAGATLVPTAGVCGSSVSLTAPLAAGSAECFIVTGLNSGVTYHFVIKVKDEVPNTSPLSNGASHVLPADVTPPAIVAPLTVPGKTVNTVNLSFTSPGDDGTPVSPCPCGTPAGYIVKYSTMNIADQTDFDNATTFSGVGAPHVAGQAEAITVGGLSPGTTYYFAVEGVDEKGNQSALGAVVMATTTQGADTFDPGQMNDLRVISVTDHSAMLQWTARGDDGDTAGGAAAAFDLRLSPLKIVPTSGEADGVTTIWFDDAASPPNQKIFQVTGEPIPGPPGSGQVMTVDLSSLTAGQLRQLQFQVSNTNLYFAIKAIDDSGNRSPLGTLTNTNVSDPIDAGCTGGAGSVNCNLRTAMRLDFTNGFLVSVPLQGPLSPTAIFGPLDGVTNWCGPNDLPCLYRWISTGVGDIDPLHYYLMDPDLCSANCVEPGEAYFFFTQVGTSVLDPAGTAVPAVTDSHFGAVTPHFHYPLLPGMNLIGNPFKKNVLLSDTHILQTGGGSCTLGEMTFAAAATAGVVGNSIYVWDGGTETAVAYNDSVAPAVLKPGQGYEFYVEDDVCSYELLVPQP